MSTLLEELPGNWKITTLGAINTRKAITLNPKKFADETFEYYSIPDYQRDQRPSFTTGSQVESSKLLLEPKTILFGKLNPRIEKVWRVTATPEFRQIGSTEWMPVLPNEDIDSDFLYFLEWSDYVMSVAKTLVSGSTPSRQRVDPKSFYQIKIPLPPLPEQKKIAHVLSTVQRAIEAQERVIQTTTELKKTLMHKLFTEGLRNEPQKQTEIGPVPESWEVITLNELCERPNGALQTGPFGSQLHKRDYQENGVAVVNPTHLSGNRINHEEVPRVSEKVADQLKRHRLQELDILFARRGEIGRHGLVTKAEKGWLCGTGCFLVRASKPFIDNRFLSYYFSTEPLIKWLYSQAAGAIMPNLNNTVLKRLPVYYPKISVQHEIVELFEKADRKTTIAKRKHDTYKALFLTLLHELMTAKIRVNAVELYQPTLSGRK